MSLSKVIALGENASVSLNLADGVGVLKISGGAGVGGGQAAGVVKVVGSMEVDVTADQMVRLALDVLKAHLPESAAALVSDLEAVAIPAIKNA